MQQIAVKLTNDIGLHARPASEFVKTAAKFQADIRIRNATRPVSWGDAKSILSVLSLGVERGHTIDLMAAGPDEEEALSTLRALVESDFGGKF
jgi:phosphotransferase system HPr (HPr) family protein